MCCTERSIDRREALGGRKDESDVWFGRVMVAAMACLGASFVAHMAVQAVILLKIIS